MRRLSKGTFILGVAGVATATISLTATEAHAGSQLMDYFKATPIVGSLSSTCWGAAQVGPRDQSNGLEDKTLAKWVYWDGGIIKGPDGTYHMFSSRWDQGVGHSGWMCCSYAVHSTSTNLYGPYTDQGTFYSFDGGKGHNVTPFLMADGQYGVSISGVRPGRVFTASSLNGPWTDKGDVVVSAGSDSFCTQCNLKIMYRPDGQYEAISSEGKLALAPTVTGPYTVQGASLYSVLSSVTDTSKLEDPSIWYSGGKYHWLTNQWATRKAYHFTSADGVKDWKLDQGYAYDPTADFVRYTNGTVNHWAHVERPEVYIENGHVAAFTFAAINVDKDQDQANDQNGSKVIVVPFDGVAFDRGDPPGEVSDAGASPDAADAGSPTDAGKAMDAGEPVDAGRPTDAGSSNNVDAGSPNSGQGGSGGAGPEAPAGNNSGSGCGCVVAGGSSSDGYGAAGLLALAAIGLARRARNIVAPRRRRTGVGTTSSWAIRL